jgi:hypothetical protein
MRARQLTGLLTGLLLAGLALLMQASAQTPESPSGNRFARFFGEWTLKDDAWSQNWGGASENIKIRDHHTLCRPINTDNSVLCVVDTPPKGHILWAFNPVRKEVRQQARPIDQAQEIIAGRALVSPGDRLHSLLQAVEYFLRDAKTIVLGVPLTRRVE